MTPRPLHALARDQAWCDTEAAGRGVRRLRRRIVRAAIERSTRLECLSAFVATALALTVICLVVAPAIAGALLRSPA